MKLNIVQLEKYLVETGKTYKLINIAECFNPQKQEHCAIQSICGLTGLLSNALRQFIAILDDASLSDVAPQMGRIDKEDSS